MLRNLATNAELTEAKANVRALHLGPTAGAQPGALGIMLGPAPSDAATERHRETAAGAVVEGSARAGAVTQDRQGNPPQKTAAGAAKGASAGADVML